jgi:beta-glucanase (GH16 family)/cytoskeletal protein CcmA (bactofilin family)
MTHVQTGWLGKCFCSIGCALLASVSIAKPPDGHYLVWADEFDGGALDLGKWDHRQLGPRGDAVVIENAVSITNGCLTITTYTSNGLHYNGMIGTDGKFSAWFGYFEAAIDFDTTPGMWSAFWLQSPTVTHSRFFDDPATSGVEIDVCEHRAVDRNGTNIAGQVQVNAHWNGYGKEHRELGGDLIGRGLDRGFHTYGLRWTPERYEVSINDVLLWSGEQAISRRSQYLILSSEMNGKSTKNWAGFPPREGYGSLATSVTRMKVDYVRYYAPTSMVFWTGAADLDWHNPRNWVAGRVPSEDHDVVLGRMGGGHQTTRLTNEVGVRSLALLETPQPLVMDGPAALRLGAGGLDLVSASQNATFNVPLILTQPQTWRVGLERTVWLKNRLHSPAPLSLSGMGVVTVSHPDSEVPDLNVRGGTLRVEGGLQGKVNVLAGASLGGSGKIVGAVKVAAGGAVALGASVGTLTVQGSLELEPEAKCVLELACLDGQSHDQLRVTGDLSLNNNVLSLAVPAGVALPGALELVSLHGGIRGQFQRCPIWCGTPPPNADDYSIETDAAGVWLRRTDPGKF